MSIEKAKAYVVGFVRDSTDGTRRVMGAEAIIGSAGQYDFPSKVIRVAIDQAAAEGKIIYYNGPEGTGYVGRKSPLLL